MTPSYLKTTDPEAYDLVLGQHWEDWLCDRLTALGLPAYRPSQQFVRAWDLQENRRKGRCRLKEYRGRLVDRHFDPSLLRPYQRDILIKVGPVKRLSIEVKALCPAAFTKPAIHVGCCPKWDQKQFRVDALVLINQATEETWVTAANREEWLRVKAIRGDQSLDYAVPRHRLSPLDAWVDFIQDLYLI